MEELDELRPLPALRLLEIWRASRDADPLERALLCNAQVLAESCFCRGERVFSSGEAVLASLTTREMESLLGRLGGQGSPSPAGVNPHFSMEQFMARKGE